MKITKSQLKQIIKEELLKENPDDVGPERGEFERENPEYGERHFGILADAIIDALEQPEGPDYNKIKDLAMEIKQAYEQPSSGEEGERGLYSPQHLRKYFGSSLEDVPPEYGGRGGL